MVRKAINLRLERQKVLQAVLSKDPDRGAALDRPGEDRRVPNRHVRSDDVNVIESHQTVCAKVVAPWTPRAIADVGMAGQANLKEDGVRVVGHWRDCTEYSVLVDDGCGRRKVLPLVIRIRRRQQWVPTRARIRAVDAAAGREPPQSSRVVAKAIARHRHERRHLGVPRFRLDRGDIHDAVEVIVRERDVKRREVDAARARRRDDDWDGVVIANRHVIHRDDARRRVDVLLQFGRPRRCRRLARAAEADIGPIGRIETRHSDRRRRVRQAIWRREDALDVLKHVAANGDELAATHGPADRLDGIDA